MSENIALRWCRMCARSSNEAGRMRIRSITNFGRESARCIGLCKMTQRNDHCGVMIVYMTRRDLGKIAVGGAALLKKRQARADTAKYTGALDGFENKVDAAGFDPVLYTRKLHDAAPLRLTFHAENRKQTEAWQKKLRVKLAEL